MGRFKMRPKTRKRAKAKRKSSGGRRRAARLARAKADGARGGAGAVHRLEITGAMDATHPAVLELEVRQLAKRYGVKIESFRSEGAADQARGSSSSRACPSHACISISLRSWLAAARCRLAAPGSVA